MTLPARLRLAIEAFLECEQDQADGPDTVTAGELRRIGFHLDPTIPDEAWIPRDAVEFGNPEVSAHGDMPSGTFRMVLGFRITKAFRWVNLKLSEGWESQ